MTSNNIIILSIIATICLAAFFCQASEVFDDERWMKTLWNHIEVLVRGFCLGFGGRMLKFSVSSSDANQLRTQLREAYALSVAAGLSMACTLYGLSVFIPKRMREYWFENDSY